ncbi:hypothetical protein QFZ49_003309 [Streptomyces turgidiscabies]|uniref:Uncharacterized protein n=1 Tax=Streptomyces turgidiscabies TaxID=85558 RepID=A0ABU0RMZ8_9ACTN|nr:hypothetical protein [Streptomyces turgidiscabies]
MKRPRTGERRPVKSYDWRHVQALGAGPRFIDEPRERECPVCGNIAVRTYMYASDRGPGRETVISYTWCASCGHFTGNTGPRPAGLRFTDPLAALSRADRIDMESDSDLFFRKLDRLWDSGELPQRFERV